MLRFNLNSIKKFCKYDPRSVYRVLCAAEGILSKEGYMTNKEVIMGAGLPFGDSYMLNLKELLLDKMSSLEDKLQYIDLASKRNFFDYRIMQDKTLNASIIKSSTIKHNNLLTVVNNKIHFKFEGE